VFQHGCLAAATEIRHAECVYGVDVAGLAATAPTDLGLLSSKMDISEMDIPSPLPPAALEILLALSKGPTHGYGILQAVRDHSRHVRLGTGSLYRHLSRLIDAGLVGEVQPKTSADPRRGSSYLLTGRGSRVLAAERDRLAALVRSLDSAARRVRNGSA
jgi:DNA-binding PadR family transcriptional regulator